MVLNASCPSLFSISGTGTGTCSGPNRVAKLPIKADFESIDLNGKLYEDLKKREVQWRIQELPVPVFQIFF